MTAPLSDFYLGGSEALARSSGWACLCFCPWPRGSGTMLPFPVHAFLPKSIW